MKRDETSTLELTLFQRRTVEHIVRCLEARNRPRRFLLADEVGLGKTIVTRAVLERLAEKHGRIRALYVTSNAAIAAQNRGKLLGPNGTAVDIGRLTLAAKELGRLVRRKEGVELFPLSYHTSFAVRGPGLAEERRLLLHLVAQTFGWNITQRLAEVFRGPARNWERERWRASLMSEFESARIDKRRLATMWRPHVERLRHATETDASLVQALRIGLTKVVLDRLEPDIVILDELQKFGAIEDARDPDSLMAHLLGRGVRVLALSATPFDLRSRESAEAHGRLMELVSFLWAEPENGPRARELKGALEQFREAITRAVEGADATTARCAIEAKQRLETCLRPIMCRTERARFVDPDADLVERRGSKDEAPKPSRRSVLDFHALAQVAEKEPPARLLDYWASCPTPLSFVDHRYRVHEELGRKALGRELRVARRDFATITERSTRLAQLARHVFGAEDDPCLHLWAPPSPTMRYYADDRLGAAPSKILVFSHWRFVPRAIATTVSALEERRLPGGVTSRTQPLRFRRRLSFSVFDVAFPSNGLAEVIRPRAIAEASPSDMIERAMKRLEEALGRCNVRVVRNARRVSPWQAIARLERDDLDALASRRVRRAHEEAIHRASHLERLAAWRAAREPLVISRAVLRRIAEIALFSPAVAFRRAFLEQYGRSSSPGHAPEVMAAMTSYFNRPIVQRVIRAAVRSRRRVIKTVGRRGYVDDILEYAVAGHIQAVADEYAFLLARVAGEKTHEDAERHLVRVLELRPPQLRVHFARQKRSEPVATHLAMAFGDRDEGDDDETTRGAAHHRETVRMAFQSPFWPFVLATTSVGQEGLDLHFYCRDVMHWNLPTSPIDLEQREGRVQRYLSFAVRRGMASSIARAQGAPPRWSELVAEARRRTRLEGVHRRGLSPHWLFDGVVGPAPAVAPSAPTIGARVADEATHASNGARRTDAGMVRHLPFAWRSKDWLRFRELESRLAIYRLTFGQPDARAWLDELGADLDAMPAEDAAATRARLRSYTLDLSPFDRAVLEAEARRCAEEILADGDRAALDRLLAHARELLESGKLTDADAAALRAVLEAAADPSAPSRVEAVAALVYLHNPFDEHLDAHPELGLVDDLEVLRAAARAVRAERRRPSARRPAAAPTRQTVPLEA